MTDSFENHVAVITGGASGIGRAAAERFARRRCRLVLADIEPEALDTAVAELQGTGAEVIGVVTDVSRADSMQALADETFSCFGATHYVFHNAGVAVTGPTQAMSDADWEWLINVNLWGPIHGTQAFLPRMLEQGEPGHHVFTASFAGIVPNCALGPYNVTKAGVVALAESLYKDLRNTNIGVSVLCPMRVETKIDDSHRNRPDSLGGAASHGYSEEALAALQGRTLSPDTVAELILAAIADNRLYIHTHKEAEPLFRKRAERILTAFENAL